LEYGMDIYSLNLRSVKNDEDLMTMLGRISANSILLFEDFDSHFVGRESTDPESKVTFSGLLNAIDGVIPLDDVLIIITTNHIEKLDQALLRPGRIDVVKEIGYATSTEASEYVSMFYNAQYTVKLSKPISMTNIQNACLANPQDPNLAIVQIEKM
jgi:chaperone BCS1